MIKDLIVDRNALDRIIRLGYTSVSVGSAPETNAILVSKQTADLAMDAAPVVDVVLVGRVSQRFGGTLYRSVKSLILHYSFKVVPNEISGLSKWSRPWMRKASAAAPCTGMCQAVCPKVDFIARMNREYLRASLKRQVKDLDTTIPTQ